MQWEERVARAVECVGTPCYVCASYPLLEVIERLESLRAAVPIRSWLSYKTHPLPALALDWIARGLGVEVVSEAELCTLLELDCPIDQLLVNGVAKHTWLGRYRLDRLRVHFDSTHEVDALLSIACTHQWRVGIRVHAPDEHDARAPEFGGQFGLNDQESVAVLRRLRDARANFESVHFHLGQGRRDPLAAARAVAHIADLCDDAGVAPWYLDCGGGLPSCHAPELPHALDGLESAFSVASMRFPQMRELWLENGRFVTESTAALAIRVVDVKEREDCRYVICDGGRTNQALAADHYAHPISILPDRGGTERLTTVCGPTCMTDDRLGRWLLPVSLSVGDIIVWLNAGAYHLPWETRFSHGLCPIVWFDREERMVVARSREQAGAEVRA